MIPPLSPVASPKDPETRRRARAGLFGGPVSSRRGGDAEGPERSDSADGAGTSSTDEKKGEKKRKVPPFRTVLKDAVDLVVARKGRLLLGLGLMLVSRLAGLVLPGMSKFLLDDVIAKNNAALLAPLAFASLLATVVQAATAFSLSQLLGKAAQRSITEMRRKIQRHVGRLSVAYFDQTKSGTLLSRVMNDAEGLRNLVGSGLVELVGGMVTAFFALIILFALNVRLTLVVLGVLSLFTLVLYLAFTRLRPLFRERARINADVAGRLSESLSGIRVVKAYGAEGREALIFSKGVHRLFRSVAKTLTGMSAIGASSTVLLGIASVAILWLGGRDVLMGRMTIGSFISFTLYLGLLVGPVVQIVGIGSQMTEAFAGLERIREILTENREDAGEGDRQPLLDIEGRVELSGVSFEYKEGSPVLHDISLVAEPGTSTALVGPSGSGKSTLIGLVAAFHRPTRGQIRVDGHDLANVRLTDYRSQLGVVFQDNFLFDGTVFENIAYARPDALESEVLDAAKIAHCDDFVQRLSEGYDTVVGERGVKLSGGERQRVAIARAILADPRILILDEATSSLDSESEYLIQEGLATLMRGRTTFVIAHRLSTIRRADTILVLEEGRIVERGKHEELLAQGGRYHALYTRQYDLQSNLFLNPGEKTGEPEVEIEAPEANTTPGSGGGRGLAALRSD